MIAQVPCIDVHALTMVLSDLVLVGKETGWSQVGSSKEDRGSGDSRSHGTMGVVSLILLVLEILNDL